MGSVENGGEVGANTARCCRFSYYSCQQPRHSIPRGRKDDLEASREGRSILSHRLVARSRPFMWAQISACL
jgi:hypothetical protein